MQEARDEKREARDEKRDARDKDSKTKRRGCGLWTMDCQPITNKPNNQ
jgi:hypothetical protein